MTQLTVCPDLSSFQEALAALASAGKTVALVPTMGALHAGHISLVNEAKELADAVAVSIFVNPKQFAPNEDFDKYPRTLEHDLQMLREAGAALVYTPAADDLYPAGFTTKVSVGPLGDMLEGQFRPGFFDGVATVVAKLLLRTLPHVAVFGEKDYQQLCVIRRMAEDLDLGIDIVGAQTLREPDGLAMSSRNAYLSAQQRAIAPRLHATLEAVADDLIDNDTPIPQALAKGVDMLTEYGFSVDYLELRREDTLEKMSECDGEARLLVAAWLGTTRLIDNIGIGVE